MNSLVRVSLAAALVLSAVCSATAAAQPRACTPADRARVAWSPPPGVADEPWRGLLLAQGLVTPATELVRIAADSMPGAGEAERTLFREMDRVVRERLGDRPVRVVVLPRVEADGTLSRLLLAQPAGGMAGIEDAIPDRVRRMRFRTAVRDGCPIATLSPMTVEILPTRTLPSRRTGTAAPGADDFSGVGTVSPWVNLVSVWRLRDEFARRPGAARYGVLHEGSWGAFDLPVELPEPFRSRAFVAESFALLEVDSAGRAAGCRPLRAGEHPELDAFACTLLMRPDDAGAARLPPREPIAGEWVVGLRWESLTGAALWERQAPLRAGGPAGRPLSTPAPGGPWVEVRGRGEGGGTWIDTASVVRVGDDVFRFTLRHVYANVLRRVSDGPATSGGEAVVEFDCRRARDRSLSRKSLLGERVVEEREGVGASARWSTGTLPWLRDAYCPLLRRVRPEPATAPPNP